MIAFLNSKTHHKYEWNVSSKHINISSSVSLCLCGLCPSPEMVCARVRVQMCALWDGKSGYSRLNKPNICLSNEHLLSSCFNCWMNTNGKLIMLPFFKDILYILQLPTKTGMSPKKHNCFLRYYYIVSFNWSNNSHCCWSNSWQTIKFFWGAYVNAQAERKKERKRGRRKVAKCFTAS